MSKPIRGPRLILIAAAAALAGIVAASLFLRPDGGRMSAEITSGTLLPQPRPIPEFTLTGSDGQPFTKAALKNQWSMIFVGFTHCPDICPNTLGLLKSVNRELRTQAKPLQVVLLSVDPERDTPEVLSRYVKYFDPSFVGATGPKEQLDPLGSALGFVYMKAPGATPETYTIDHSSALILINPQAQVAGYFTPPFRIDALTADLAQLIPSAS